MGGSPPAAGCPPWAEEVPGNLPRDLAKVESRMTGSHGKYAILFALLMRGEVADVREGGYCGGRKRRSEHVEFVGLWYFEPSLCSELRAQVLVPRCCGPGKQIDLRTLMNEFGGVHKRSVRVKDRD